VSETLHRGEVMTVGLHEWLTDPLGCISAIWRVWRFGADTPVDLFIPEAGRAELRAVLGPPAYECAAHNAQLLP
jgi:hypothetical protein